jgi:PAS domain S-box-containing protein
MGTTGKRGAPRAGAKPSRRAPAHGRRAGPAHEAGEQFRLAQEALGIVTWIWDPASDRVQWHGDMGRMLGLPAGRFEGRFDDYLARVHPEDAARARQTFVECLKGARPEYRASERVVWPDGAVHWLETYGRAEYSRSGRAMRLMGVIKDITERKRQEELARQSQSKYSTLFETAPVGLVVTRPRERVVVEANDEALRIFNLRREQVLGRRTNDLFVPEDPGQVELLRERLLEGRLIANAIRFRCLDGAEREGLFSGGVMEFEGEPHFMLSILDVTEQRRAERAEHEADARYRTLFATAIDGFVITTPDHTIIDANPAACALTGYAREALIGSNVRALYSTAELMTRPLRQDLAKRWGLLEREMTRRDGSLLPVEVRAGPMPDGRALGIIRDLTERKQTEALVMNIARGVSADTGEAFFRSLVEHLARELGADMAFIGEIASPGEDRVRTLACVTDGAIGPNFEYRLEGSPCINAVSQRGTVIYPEGVAELFPRDSGLKRRGIQAYVGTSLHAADGRPLGVLVVMSRRPVERGRFWASMIEIFGARAAAEIERARAEALVRETNASLEQQVHVRTAELEDANRALESYNYSISHDLRQPLGAIGGFAELLRENAGALGPAAADSLREIEGNAARMERMIEALLELSRAGRGAPALAEVDSAALVESVLRDHAAEAPLGGIVHVGDLPAARGDGVLLRQVWANLIGNALKYSRLNPSPRVEIGGALQADWVEYRVRDNGIGFEKRFAARLFEPFHRLPSAADFEGNGIGLAVAERIVRRHGGRIEAESTPGEGSTFRFFLPR